MWIFCCGMPRSGSTLQYQLTKEIVESNNVGKGLGWVEPEQFPNLQTNYMNDNRLLVIKCHSYINGAQDLISRGEAKAIYVYRDLRDVIVSIMNKNKTSFRHVMQSGFIHSILQEYDNWNKLNDIFVAKYENMIKDLAQETLKIAKYIGVDLDKSSAVKIAGKYTIEQQVKRIQSFDYNTYGVRSGKNNYDPDFLLHDSHIFSGNTKQWIKMLSPFEIGLIEDIAYDWLLDKNYSISQALITRKASALFYFTLYLFHLSNSYMKKVVSGLPLKNTTINILKEKISRGVAHIYNGTLFERLQWELRQRIRRRRKLWWDSQVGKQEYFETKIHRGVRMRLHFDSELSKLIYCEDFEWQERHFLNSFLRPRDVFVDVGANIGLYSLIAAHRVGLAGRVYAFEPTNEIYQRLCYNVQLNHFSNIACFQLALSDKAGEFPFFTSMDGLDAWNSLAKPTTGRSITTVTAKCATWNDFARAHDLIGKVTMMKIDVEGWESYVLSGGHELFSRHDAPVLQVEFTENATHSAASSCITLYHTLEALGYQMFTYVSKTRDLVYDPIRISYSDLNLIATKRPDQVINRLR